jgi:DNA mismatch repair protein MutL
MGKIQKLPEDLIRLIAAGEVIERPASVLKEVVENSLDAGARRISIDIWGAGRTRIRVSDDGCGMAPEDAELAMDRHATSKLRSFDDLQALHSFGFRGEALPSIAAVSQFELTTREAAAPQGWRIKLSGGRVVSREAVGVPPGTTVDIQDLFFNTPARAKFMKRDTTERAHILRTVQEIALAHPGTHFEISVEGKAAMLLSPAKTTLERVRDVWDSAVTRPLIEIDFSVGPVRVEGLINAIPAHQGTKAYQHLFVNRRPIQQRQLSHAMYEAYHEWLPVGRHPVFVLFITIDPAEVDVNVHPSKREVRFANDRALYDALFHQIRKRLQTTVGVPAMHESGSDGGNFVNIGGVARSSYVSDAAVPLSLSYVDAALAMQSGVIPHIPAGSVGTSSQRLDGNLRILGQFQKVYILAEQGEELILIDQHAAAERVLYEKLLQRSRLSGTQGQPLLTPYLWELPPDRAERVREAEPALQAIGFVLSDMGGNSFALKEWPAVFPQLREAKRFLDVFIESLEQESHDHEENAAHEAVARAACRAAIKANDDLAPAEMHHLLRELAACERPMTCPHGRPTHIRLPLSELHRRFRRT